MSGCDPTAFFLTVCLQIGVVGWITPTTGETSRDVGGVKFTPIVPSVKACLDILNKEQPNLDFVIGLSHSGVLCTQLAIDRGES
jgi:2',3'-cyclic-nucleotide 2'-phosphodiesterase (5'-nucleotidase family)